VIRYWLVSRSSGGDEARSRGPIEAGRAAPGSVSMLMRKLGRTGLRVAALCLGGNTFGWTTDQKASEAVLDAYAEAGGNFIDTADVYSRWAPGNSGGESEAVLGGVDGRAREPPRGADRHQGHGANGDRTERHGPLTPAHHAGGRGLAAPAADRLHRPLPGPLDDRDTPLGETLRAFDDLVGQGKVRYVGASNYHAWRLTRALWESDKRGYVQYESLQPKYNLVMRDEYERELEPSVSSRAWASSPTHRSGAGSCPVSTARGRMCPQPRAPAACRRPT